MLSTENRIVVVFGIAALVLAFGLSALTDLPTWVGVAAILVVGVVVPQLVTGYLERAG